MLRNIFGVRLSGVFVLALLLAVISVVDGFTAVTGGSITKGFSFEMPDIDVVGGVSSVGLSGCDKFIQVGAPKLPVLDVSILIPAGKNISGITVEHIGEEQVAGNYDVEYSFRPYPLSRPDMVESTVKDVAIYGSDAVFPAERYEFTGLQSKHGYKIATVRLFPVRYCPLSGRLFRVSGLKFKLELEDVGIQLFGGSTVVPRWSRRSDVASIEAIVVNPEDVAGFKPLALVGGVSVMDGGVTSNDVMHVIITTEALAGLTGPGSFQALSDARNNSGITSRVVTKEWINAYYHNGDQQKRIRDFICDAYELWGTRYVLLGGDADLIPPRHFQVSAYPGMIDNIPADLYYGCLDGSFDSNGNGIYGELYDGADKGYGDSDVDLLGEVSVGRAAVATADKMANFVQKTLAYENSSSPALMKAVMVGEHLGFGGVAEFGKNAMEQIRLGGTYDEYSTTGFEDSHYADFFDTTEVFYDVDAIWSKDELIDSMNGNKHIYNHLGHCNRTYAMKMVVDDLGLLNNTDYFFIYSQGCMPGWFDNTSVPCFAQVATTMNGGGAFAVVMNARYGWGSFNSTDGPSQRFDREFWDCALGDDDEDGVMELGWMNQYSKERNIARINESCMRWCTYELNLFGDPVTKLMVELGGIDLSRLAYRSDAKVDVTVRDRQAAVDTNQVTVLWMTRDAIGTTRASGSVVLAKSVDEKKFTGSFTLRTSVDAVHGDVLHCVYSNLVDNFEAVALIDDNPPVITNVRVATRSDNSATIVWDTDESSDGYALSGLVVPLGLYGWIGDPELVGWGSSNVVFEHTVVVPDLEPFGYYYYAVRSSDAAGNAVTYPLDLSSPSVEDYPSFMTLGRNSVFKDDMESGEGRWEHTGLNDIWEYGAPKNGPLVANSGTNCWATSLSGGYNNLMNAWLVSQPIWVGSTPRIEFAEWHSIERGSDAGYVEVNGGLGWINVSSNIFGEVSVDGESGGWKQRSIVLPDSLANRTVQVRFRLISDRSNTQDGWYIDDFSIIYAEEAGLGIKEMSLPVEDSTSLSDENDGDGYPEPGETSDIEFNVVNTSLQDINGVSALVTCTAEGVTIVSGYDTLNLGDVGAEELERSQNSIRVVLDADVAHFSRPITFLFHIEGDGGYNVERELAISFNERDSIQGCVTDTFGVAVTGATLTAESAEGEIWTATSSDGGAYIIPGILAGDAHSVKASYPGVYSPSEMVSAVAPTSGVDFVLGKAYADVSPALINLTMKQHDESTVMVEIANTNAFATIALKVTPTSSFESDNIILSYEPAGEIIVNPGTVVTVAVDIAVNSYVLGMINGFISFVGNAMVADPLISVAVDVESGGMLLLGDFSAEESDGDGFIEAGESSIVSLELLNRGGSTAAGVTGVVRFVGTDDVVMMNSAVTFGDIMVNGSSSSLGEAVFMVGGSVPNGTQLPFVLDVWDAGGVHWNLDFNFTVDERQCVYGSVVDMATPGVFAGVSVRASGADGMFVGQSDTNGEYHIYGLGMGIYTVRVDGVSGYGLPSEEEADTTAGDVNLNFIMYPLDVTLMPSDLTFVIDEGRSTSAVVQVSNNGIMPIDVRVSGAMVAGSLDAPDTHIPAAVNWASLTTNEASLSQVIVGFRDQASMARLSGSLLSGGGTRVVRSLKLVSACLVEVESGSGVTLGSVAEELTANADVVYVQPDYRYKLLDMPERIEPNDPFYMSGEQWGLENDGQENGTVDADIDAAEAWAMTRGSTNVVVAILDTGGDIDHPDLMENLWVNSGEIPDNGFDDDGNGYIDDVHGYNFLRMLPGWSFVWTNVAPIDDVGHGTHVAGIVGAVGDNATGVAGVSWNVKLMILKIGDKNGFSDWAAAEALEYAILNGARISNNSWGGTQYSFVFHDLITEAAASNHLVICAAGNDGTDNDVTPYYPAGDTSPNVLSVAATDRDGLLADFSNYGGNSVDIAAPGVDIISTVPFMSIIGDGSTYASKSGTSMASPCVAGVAALLLGYAPDVSWQMLREALVLGVVADSKLEDKLTCGGHLNAYRSLQTISSSWLKFSPDELTVSAGGSSSVAVTVNESKRVGPGVYRADAVFESGVTRTNVVPVNLTVNYAPVPMVFSVRVDDSAAGDGDGYAEPGEEVDLYIMLRNSGSLTLEASSGTLSSVDPTVTFIDSSPAWSAIYSKSESESTAVKVRFAAGAEREVEFTLDVSDGGAHADWKDLVFSLDVGVRRTLSGIVTDAATGLPLEGAEIEFYGADAGRAMTTSGGVYGVGGLLDGTVTIRAQISGYGASEWTNVVIAGVDVVHNFTLGSPDVCGVPITLQSVMLEGDTKGISASVTNIGVTDLDFSLHEMHAAKIGVFSDSERLSDVEDLLSGMGFDVVGYADNLTEGYSLDIGSLSLYDICIIDLGGEIGYGRKYSSEEVAVFWEYVSDGGKLILSGRNLLGSPDNCDLAELIGSESVGLQDDVESKVFGSGGADEALSGYYCSVSNGAQIEVNSQRYDVTGADGSNTVGLLEVGGGYKITRSILGGGELIYWSGNFAGTDWGNAGVLQDIFKNIITGWQMRDVPWLTITSPTQVTVAAGADTTITVTTSFLTGMELGTNSAVVLVRANLPDIPDRWIRVESVAKAVVLNAGTSLAVTRWDATNLEGNGNVDSCIYQLIYAGSNGVADAATGDGHVTGDDVILLTADSFDEFGRFGDGFELQPDHGLFARLFGYGELSIGAQVYVRAWDAKSFELAVAYGDSSLYELQRVADEEYDFGGWVVGTAPGYPGSSFESLKDINNDTIPDGWAIANGLDPRNPVAPLDQEVVHEISYANDISHPQKVVVSSNFVFVADTDSDMVRVLSRDLSTLISTYTGLVKPRGLDFYAAGNRLIVADTDNFRIVLLDVDPVSGVLSYAGEFGSRGTDPGQFDRPVAVAVSQSSGRIFVVDSDNVNVIGCNHRVQRFSAGGVFELSFGNGGSGSAEFNWPQGISVAANGFVYIADTGNNRIKCVSSDGGLLWTYGTYGNGDGEFMRPCDVREGAVGWLYVADTDNNRIVLLDTTAMPTSLHHIGNYGSNGNEDGEFRYPHGLFPMADGYSTYVADTLNNRIQRVHLVADADGDGMEDLWEDLFNAVSPRNGTDWAEDPDEDGVSNLGEFRAGTNPDNIDSNDNGLNDGDELASGRDPSGDGFDFLLIRTIESSPFGLNFNVESGLLYQVEFTTNLMSSVWQAEGTNVVGPANGIYEWTATPSLDPTRFYRIININ